MSRLAVAITVLLVVAAPTSAAAKDIVEPRAQAMLSCASVAEDEARLRCYDQSVLALKQALDEGALVQNERSEPSAREGVVKAAGRMGENRYWVELDSGDHWELNPTSDRDGAPPTGTTLKVSKGIMGNYWIAGPGWSASPARYLRRRP